MERRAKGDSFARLSGLSLRCASNAAAGGLLGVGGEWDGMARWFLGLSVAMPLRLLGSILLRLTDMYVSFIGLMGDGAMRTRLDFSLECSLESGNEVHFEGMDCP